MFLIFAGVVRADRYVWSDSPSPGAPYDAWTNAAHDIQTAVDAASDETVWVTNGTYTITSEIAVPSGITLRGGVDRSATLLTGGYPATTNRIINLSGGVVHGFTITNGYIDVGAGGGVYMGTEGGTISNCTIVGNSVASIALTSSARYGGGGVCIDLAVNGLVQNCDIRANRSVGVGGKSQGGGGVMLYYGTATIRNCLIVDNVNDNEGGGAYLNGSGTVMEDSVISNNVSYSRAGGVFIRYGGKVRGCEIVENVVTAIKNAQGGGVFFSYGGSISNCTVRGNVSDRAGGSQNNYGGGAYILLGGDIIDSTITENEGYRGGGVYATGNASNVGGSIRNSLICENEATERGAGGGLYLTGGKDGGPLVENCTIVNNESGYGGGIEFASGGRARNCLVAANKAVWYGGGLRGKLGEMGYVENCTIVRNDAGDTGGGVNLEIGSLTNCIVWYNEAPQSTNLFADTGVNVGYSCSPDLTDGLAGNLAGIPYFKDSGAGAGLSATLGDYRLAGRSPCIDTGINLPWMVGALDFEGNPRVYPANGRVDMGVYEDITARGTVLFIR